MPEANTAQEKTNLLLCPYCGSFEKAPAERCTRCGGFFDGLSRKVSQQHMGPWFIRDTATPFRPGCSFEVIEKLCMKKKIKPDTVMRGPTTRQFWQVAWRVPGVAHLIGFCHACEERLPGIVSTCPHCGVTFARSDKRQELGLDPLDSSVFEQVAQVRAAQSAAPSAPQAPSTVSVSEAPEGTEAAKAKIVSTTSVASIIDHSAEESAEALEEEGDDLAAMAWMSSSGEFRGDPTPSEPAASGGASPVVVGLITLNLLLIVAVGAVMLLDQGEIGDGTSFLGTDKNTQNTEIAPPPGRQPAPRPNTARAGIGNGGTRPAPNTSNDTAPANPTKNTTSNTDGKGPFRANPTANTPPAASSGPSFFGIPINISPVGGLTQEQAADFNQRFERAADFSKKGQYREALRLLEGIKNDLPFGEVNDGLEKSIKAVEAKLREKAVKPAGPATAAGANDAPKASDQPTEAERKALEEFFN